MSTPTEAAPSQPAKPEPTQPGVTSVQTGSALVPSSTQSPNGPDEIEFFDFAKKYLGLLASLAAVPLLTNGLGVIPTPGGSAYRDLSAAASLLSIIAFGAVFSLRQILGRTQESRRYAFRAIPALLVLLTLTGAGWLMSVYLPQVNPAGQTSTATQAANAQPAPASNSTQPAPATTTPITESGQPAAAPAASGVPDTAAAAPAAAKPTANQTAPANPVAAANGATIVTAKLIGEYFLIQVLIVLAIGIVLITAFTMQEAHKIQNMIERDMQAERFQLLTRLRYTDDFYKLARDNPAFQVIGKELVLDLRHRDLAELARGRIDAFGDTARQLQERLLNQYKKTFDAVSDRDLDFWRDKDLDAFSQAYDQLLATAAERGTRLTRLLLFSDEELLKWRCVSKVLQDHEERGYGWAVAPCRTIDRAVLDTEHDLDFALFDGTSAITYFRDYHSTFRQLQVIFGGFAGLPNTKIITDQAERYLKLSAQAWVGNAQFAKRIGGILGDLEIGTHKLNKTFVGELQNALKATTTADMQFLPEDERAQVRRRVQTLCTDGSQPEQGDWRSGMLIDPRELHLDADGPLPSEDIDLIAWTILRYRRGSPTWNRPVSCDMLLVTGLTMSQANGTSDCTLRADVRGIACSLSSREKAVIKMRVANVHGEIVHQHDEIFQRDRYDASKDIYSLRLVLQIAEPGRYSWEVSASDNSEEEHCQRKADRKRWFEVKAVPAQTQVASA